MLSFYCFRKLRWQQHVSGMCPWACSWAHAWQPHSQWRTPCCPCRCCWICLPQTGRRPQSSRPPAAAPWTPWWWTAGRRRREGKAESQWQVRQEVGAPKRCQLHLRPACCWLVIMAGPHRQHNCEVVAVGVASAGARVAQAVHSLECLHRHETATSSMLVGRAASQGATYSAAEQVPRLSITGIGWPGSGMLTWLYSWALSWVPLMPSPTKSWRSWPAGKGADTSVRGAARGGKRREVAAQCVMPAHTACHQTCSIAHGPVMWLCKATHRSWRWRAWPAPARPGPPAPASGHAWHGLWVATRRRAGERSVRTAGRL